MKKQLKLLSLIFLTVIVTSQIYAQDATKAHKDSLNTVIEMYYDLNLNKFL